MTQQKTQSEELIQALKNRNDDLEGGVARAEAQFEWAEQRRAELQRMLVTVADMGGAFQKQARSLDQDAVRLRAELAASEEDRNALSNHCAALEDQLEKALGEVGTKVSFDVETLVSRQREAVLKLLSAGWVVGDFMVLVREMGEATVDSKGHTTVHPRGTL